MKIALVILHADPARGGAERYTIDLASALTARGHDVELIAVSFGKTPTDVRTIQLMARRPLRTWTYYAFLRLVDQHIRRSGYDIVHAMLPVRRCDIYHPHAGIAAAAVREESALSLLFNPRRRAMARVERQLLTAATPPILLSLADYVKKSIVESYPELGERIEILFNAVDLDRFQPAERAPRQGVNALTIAQDFDRKGLATAIAALGLLKDEPVRLTVVGGDAAAPYQRLAEESGIGDRVKFVGRVADPRPYLADADYFLLPTKNDPCSLVVLEALAMGIPVITTSRNGAAEVMTQGVHGFILSDPMDVTALAEAMRRMGDATMRARMSAACLELRDRLSYEKHIQRLLTIYERVADRSHAASLPGRAP